MTWPLFPGRFRWVDYDSDMWTQAAELWAIERRRGRAHDDADLLIAAFARKLGATMVTNNVADFVSLDVLVVDWTVERTEN